MSRIFLGAAIAVAVLLTSEPSWSQSAKLTKAVTLDRAEFALTPAALAFDGRGQLYVGYRDKGTNKKSSAIWIRLIDPAGGKELRSVQLQTAPVTLPNGANQFKLSPDNSVLLYSQFHEATFVTMLDSTTLQKISETTSLPEGVDQEFPKVVGIDPSGGTVLLAAEKTNRNKGTDVRILKLSIRDLNHVLSDTTQTNPIPESGFAVGANGAVRILKSNTLYSYDSAKGTAAPQISVHNQDDIRNVLFLDDGSLLFWSNQNEFGYLYHLEPGKTSANSQRIEKCGVKEIALSSDQLYGAALCEHQNLGEIHFGNITSRSAVVFDTRTLKILGQVPLEKDLYPEFAIWHGNGKIVLATDSDSNKLGIYELADH